MWTLRKWDAVIVGGQLSLEDGACHERSSWWPQPHRGQCVIPAPDHVSTAQHQSVWCHHQLPTQPHCQHLQSIVTTKIILRQLASQHSGIQGIYTSHFIISSKIFQSASINTFLGDQQWWGWSDFPVDSNPWSYSQHSRATIHSNSSVGVQDDAISTDDVGVSCYQDWPATFQGVNTE